MKKRVVSSILIFVLLMTCFALPSSAASTIFLSGANYPSSYKEGNTFSVRGTVSSDYTLTYVWVGAYKADGTVMFYYDTNPQSKSFDIHSVDAQMTFSKLPAGTYTYKIAASNSKESKTVLLSKQFTVLKNQSTFTLTNETYPTSLQEGKTFSIYGNLSCDDEITSLTAGVYKSDGTTAFSKTVNPNSTYYNLHNIDAYLTFSKLTAGSYKYKIIASTASTENYVVLEKSFTVATVITAESKLKKVSWNVYDISSWTTINDWKSFVKGVDAVILRMGYTGSRNRSCVEDSEFKKNYDKLTSMGIPVGCYYFSLAITTAEAERDAQFVIDVLKKYNCKMSMPVYFDAETEDQMSLNDTTMTNVVRAFCDKLTANGYYAGFYCSKSFLTDEVYDDRLTDITKWIAQYSEKCYYSGSYGMWQYSASGDVGGTYDPIDLNKCYCDYVSYIKDNGLNGFAKKPVEPPQNPEFSIKQGETLSIKNNTIRLKFSEITAEDFTSKYIEKTSDVTVSFENTKNGRIITGTKIIAKAGTSTLAEYTVCMSGDVVADGTLNSSDALFVLQYAVNLINLTDIQKESADMNGDGEVNSVDALSILTAVVGG